MIEKKDIEKLVTDFLTESQFLVDIQVSQSNAVRVFIDDMNGLNIDACKFLSRKIESSLDLENEDFELEVSSPGLGKAFKVMQQYTKCVGRTIEVSLTSGIKIEGILKQVNTEDIAIEIIKKASSKKQEPVIETLVILFRDIKTANEKLIY